MINNTLGDIFKFAPVYVSLQQLLTYSKIERLSNYGQPQEAFLYSVITAWKNTEEYKNMLLADRYFQNKADIIDRTRKTPSDGLLEDDPYLTNTKLLHPFFYKLTRQKVNYIFSKPLSISTENKEFEEELKFYFNKDLNRIIKNRGKEAIIKGKSWLYVYYDENNKLSFRTVPSEEIKPFWADDEHTKLDAVARSYSIIDYGVKGEPKQICYVEFFTNEGIWKYEQTTTGLKLVRTEYIDENGIKQVEPNPRPYFSGKTMEQKTRTIKDEEGNEIEETYEEEVTKDFVWNKVPWICFKYNEEEMSLLEFIKSMIDDYDTNTSDVSNFLQDVPNSIKVISNYGGEDLGEFNANIRKYRAVIVEGDGGLSSINTPIDSASYETHLNRLRKDIYDFASGVDTQSTDLGNASGQALKFRYADLDLDANYMINEFNAALNDLLWFIKVDILARYGHDHFEDEVTFVFNTDMIVNEETTIENAKNSVGLISDKTIVANHPWVTNVEEELKQMQKEKDEAQEQFDITAMNNTNEDVDDDADEDENTEPDDEN